MKMFYDDSSCLILQYKCVCVCVCLCCWPTSHHSLCQSPAKSPLKHLRPSLQPIEVQVVTMTTAEVVHSTDAHPQEAPFLISFTQIIIKKGFVGDCQTPGGEAADKCLGADSCRVCMKWTWRKKKRLFIFSGWIRGQVRYSHTYKIRERSLGGK